MSDQYRYAFTLLLTRLSIGLYLLSLIACGAPGTEDTPAPQELLYVGTYSVRNSQGIYAYRFDRQDTTFELVQTIAGPDSPTFLDISPDGRFLYSANRQGVPGDTLNGSVSAYQIDPLSGVLEPLNTISSFGVSPCHIATDGRRLFLSHYLGGSLSILSLNPDGSIGRLVDSVQHYGRSAHPDRQQSPHVHSIRAVPGSDYFLAADLGADQLTFYALGDTAVLPAAIPPIRSPAGAGPRHFTFSADARYLYVAEELSSTVSVYELDLAQASAELIQRLSTLPPEFTGNNTVADIHLSPDERFLYVSNRGHNSLAIFAVDHANGRLEPPAHQPTLGKTPRNFLLDPQGAFALVANQDSDEIVFFARDSTSGLLRPGSQRLQLPSPVCLQWLMH